MPLILGPKGTALSHGPREVELNCHSEIPWLLLLGCSQAGQRGVRGCFRLLPLPGGLLWGHGAGFQAVDSRRTALINSRGRPGPSQKFILSENILPSPAKGTGGAEMKRRLYQTLSLGEKRKN